jgi:hypothetical protein
MVAGVPGERPVPAGLQASSDRSDLLLAPLNGATSDADDLRHLENPVTGGKLVADGIFNHAPNRRATGLRLLHSDPIRPGGDACFTSPGPQPSGVVCVRRKGRRAGLSLQQTTLQIEEL